MPIINNALPAPFPLYLFPSIPFRRRSSTVSTTTNSTVPSPSSSPPQPTGFLSSASTSHLRCSKCLTDLIPTSSIISKGFTGRHGRAYLVSPPATSALYPAGTTPSPSDMKPGDLPNTHIHKAVPRQLVTGAHTVSDISCRTCGSVLGWKYVEAEEESQRYKVGKYILETKRLVRGTGWEVDEEDREEMKAKVRDEDIEFDSEDEDECEDLFAGMWTPQLAAKRRKNKQF
ncbi:yippee-domain-containing protein [Bimuria novae-zelandiae CBS 107.79]|uniref:Yippee-domain-containing protein n=1 Tax=Bimuria novae-zelandiae CBS 107.79 TaxID=1447943 RepID=A0A6A5VTG7_9PLEO|nr:yippee-domain-containing protein [Bimuria novae-zelandiae CBS 107.79]